MASDADAIGGRGAGVAGDERFGRAVGHVPRPRQVADAVGVGQVIRGGEKLLVQSVSPSSPITIGVVVESGVMDAVQHELSRHGESRGKP
jgi:hypothetical protein